MCSRLSKHGTEAGRLERDNQLGQPAQRTEWKDEGKREGRAEDEVTERRHRHKHYRAFVPLGLSLGLSSFLLLCTPGTCVHLGSPALQTHT